MGKEALRGEMWKILVVNVSEHHWADGNREPQQVLEGCFVSGKVMLGQSLVQNGTTR